MFEKIAVCLDGSQLAEQILPYAAQTAQRFESAVVLLRVVGEPFLVGPGVPGAAGGPVVTPGMERHVEEEEGLSDAYLKTVASRLEKEYGFSPECVTLLGAAGKSIIDYVHDNDVGLIAIATHGRSGPARVLFGSVADYVMRQSRLPLLLVRPTTKTP